MSRHTAATHRTYISGVPDYICLGFLEDCSDRLITTGGKSETEQQGATPRVLILIDKQYSDAKSPLSLLYLYVFPMHFCVKWSKVPSVSPAELLNRIVLKRAEFPYFFSVPACCNVNGRARDCFTFFSPCFPSTWWPLPLLRQESGSGEKGRGNFGKKGEREKRNFTFSLSSPLRVSEMSREGSGQRAAARQPTIRTTRVRGRGCPISTCSAKESWRKNGSTR